MAALVGESIAALIDHDPGALDDDDLKALVVALVRAQSRLHAAVGAAVGELDARAAYLTDGAVDARAWLAHHTGIARRAAGALVWLTKRLAMMPQFAAALAAAEITVDHARAAAHALNPRTLAPFARDEAVLIDQARRLEADDFARAVTRWAFLADQTGPQPRPPTPSHWHVSPLLEGRHRVDGELDLEDAIDYTAELERLYQQIWRADHDDTATPAERARTRSQRLAAAQIEMARRSAAAADDGPPIRKPLIIARVDLPALAGDPTGDAELDDGTPLPQPLLQRWLCDCAVSRVVLQGPSIPFDLGKITYTATDGQRRVLNTRDRGCIIPGCGRPPRWCQAHHVIPWPAGPTNIANLVLVCHRHHKHIHHGTITITADPTGGFTITRPDGTPLHQRPPPATTAA